MPRTRPGPNAPIDPAIAPVEPFIGLREAGPLVNYSPEYLRKLMWTDDPPPFVKRRGKWVVAPSELVVWAERYERDRYVRDVG